MHGWSQFKQVSYQSNQRCISFMHIYSSTKYQNAFFFCVSIIWCLSFFGGVGYVFQCSEIQTLVYTSDGRKEPFRNFESNLQNDSLFRRLESNDSQRFRSFTKQCFKSTDLNLLLFNRWLNRLSPVLPFEMSSAVKGAAFWNENTPFFFFYKRWKHLFVPDRKLDFCLFKIIYFTR